VGVCRRYGVCVCACVRGCIYICVYVCVCAKPSYTGRGVEMIEYAGGMRPSCKRMPTKLCMMVKPGLITLVYVQSAS